MDRHFLHLDTELAAIDRQTIIIIIINLIKMLLLLFCSWKICSIKLSYLLLELIIFSQSSAYEFENSPNYFNNFYELSSSSSSTFLFYLARTK